MLQYNTEKSLSQSYRINAARIEGITETEKQMYYVRRKKRHVKVMLLFYSFLASFSISYKPEMCCFIFPPIARRQRCVSKQFSLR